ncbi:MAG: hypothetical protein GY788_06565, partial [bacterium]|nr:hypothetical protein [bacterium]
GEDDLQLSLVRRAKPFALAEMRSTVVEALGSATDRAPLVNAEVVSEIVDAEFCAQLATLADGGSVRVSEFLLGILAASCLDEAKGLMVGILTDSSAGRAEQLAAIKTLLDYTPDTAWETVGPALRGDGGRELAAQIAYFDRPVPPISVEHLGELYEVLCHHYPPEDDPPAKGGAVSPEQSARWWRDAVLRALRDRGSSEAVVVLRSLVVKMPGRPWLQTAVDHAVGVLRQTSWTALSPAEIHRLVLEPRARIVRSLPQLARVVEHALDDIADRLKGATPEGVLLWNDAKLQRPKSEGAFSDYLANRLRDALQGRRIVVNREVEIRPRPTGVGERTDLLVQAASSAEDLLQLPIEVKGCWHRDVLTAMEGQLYAQYMVDLGVDVGVYLVGWFPVDDWTDTSDRNRARQARLGTQVELLEVLEQQSAGLKSKRAVAITPRVLAVPYTRLEEED